MNRPEFDSEFCNVQYIEEDHIVLLTWKSACYFDSYREPVCYALSLLRSFPKSTLAVDLRNGFEVVREDIEWNFTFLLPALLQASCKQIILINQTSGENEIGRNPWAGQFLQNFNVRTAESYQGAVKVNKQGLKRVSNKLAGGVLLYELFIFVATFIYMIVVIIYDAINSRDTNVANLMSDQLVDKLTASGLPYIIAIIPGILFLFWFYKKLRVKETLFQNKRKMTLKTFLLIFCVFMSAQGIFSIIGGGAEALFNLFGLSIMDALEAATNKSTTVSMFLYASFLAPITEEIVFRGFILRGLEKYGRVFAIVVSAILFGAMHGNLIQGLFAAMIGLVLGYVAIEYSIYWTILLHMINNFVFGDLLSRLLDNFSDTVQNFIWVPMQAAFFIGAVVILICYRKNIKNYLRSEKTSKGLYKISLTSACMLVFLILQFLLSLSGITRI